VTISLGLVTVQPADDTDPEELIDRADAALYRAKRDGRNRVAVA
jgi:two-component system chemotaxis family response regulator WspR